MSENINTSLTVNDGFSGIANTDVLHEAMTDDCQGLEFTFDRVKLPSGGGIAFEIPYSDRDGYEMARELTGVIVYNHPAFACYHHKYTGGNFPPDCSSYDGIRGVGNPGGYCADCPYNKYGSGEGKSKLCKNKRTLYIMRPGEKFPITLSLPTGSLKPFANYVKNLLFSGKKLNQVVTEITLKKAVNSTGIVFSQAMFTCSRPLAPPECVHIAGLSNTIKAYVSSLVPVSMSEQPPLVDPETGEVVELWD